MKIFLISEPLKLMLKDLMHPNLAIAIIIIIVIIGVHNSFQVHRYTTFGPTKVRANYHMTTSFIDKKTSIEKKENMDKANYLTLKIYAKPENIPLLLFCTD